jgi:glycosyltransferase involved in cell wall biosynthesis
VTPCILFVQKRAHRAGAQTCLARLLRHPGLRPLQPVVVCSESGWLVEECQSEGVPVILEPFPSSRSVIARAHGNGAFARRVCRQVREAGLAPSLVHANDHLEGLLGLRLARRLEARSAIFLRSPGMTRADYVKYRCAEYDLITVVGDGLHAQACTWDPGRDIRLIHDGIGMGEFASPKPKAPEFPRRVLVVGSPLDWKGWADMTEALFQLQSAGELPEMECDFTGVQPDAARNDLRLARLTRVRCNFLGRVEQFPRLVRGYDLVINPTRMESFGMAAVEVVALGVPLLSSRTGIIEQVIRQPEFLFPPAQPTALATALCNLMHRWGEITFDAEAGQARIRGRFLVDHAAEKLCAEYARLGVTAEWASAERTVSTSTGEELS